MSQYLDVFLHSLLVGQLVEDDRGRVSFRFVENYKNTVPRPVLSQSFEDDLARPYRGKKNKLPSYFANLVPEGLLRDLIESSLQVPKDDDLSLLRAVGSDLPGAVEIRPGSAQMERSGEVEEEEEETLPSSATENGELRFSLAGVQLKFSVLREADKLTLPAHGLHGDWIVKLDMSRFANAVANEFATLSWARASGFDVPECYLQKSSTLSEPLRSLAPAESDLLVIRRYDRKDGRRIHQEDFAQVTNVSPLRKYDNVTYEQCAFVIREIAGDDAYLEFVRRLAFVIASGNNDAHLKNWSLLYPDSVNPVLAPVYDQVSTVAWPELRRKLALGLAGNKDFGRIDESSFSRLAVKANADSRQTIATLREALDRIFLGWSEANAWQMIPAGHLEALYDHWSRVPLLRHQAGTLRAQH